VVTLKTVVNIEVLVQCLEIHYGYILDIFWAWFIRDVMVLWYPPYLQGGDVLWLCRLMLMFCISWPLKICDSVCRQKWWWWTPSVGPIQATRIYRSITCNVDYEEMLNHCRFCCSLASPTK